MKGTTAACCKEQNRKPKARDQRKTVLALLFLLCGSYAGWAQNAGPVAKSFWEDPTSDPLFPIYIISTFVLAIMVLVLIVALLSLRVINTFTEKAAEERAERLGITYVRDQSWWAKAWQDMNAMVPVNEESTIELEHNYDGIRELDNHLPPWWKGLFYGTIVFAVIYLCVFHIFNTLPLSEQEYQDELSDADAQAKAFKASQPAEVIDETNLAFTNDAVMIAHGKAVFISSNCQSCHRNDGGGNIGPNLTDAYWLHGGEIANIFATIKNGVVEKAMPAWGKVMSQKDVRDVTFYVISLQGTNPEGAKAPQGELFKPKQESKPQDTTKVQALMVK